MKTIVRRQSAPSRRRGLFAEIAEGMAALSEARRGIRTLRTHRVEDRVAPK